MAQRNCNIWAVITAEVGASLVQRCCSTLTEQNVVAARADAGLHVHLHTLCIRNEAGAHVLPELEWTLHRAETCRANGLPRS